MENAQILDTLTGIFRDKLDRENINLTPDTTAKDVKGWDSLTQIQIVAAAEKHFKIRFTSSEIANFRNIGDMCGAIARRTAI